MSDSRDGYAVLVTDYAWPSLEIERSALEGIGGRLVVAEGDDDDELVQLAPEVDAILTCWRPVTSRALEAATKCRMVSRYGVGLDNIDVQRATELGMLVTNVPDFCLEEVSDHAMALLLACARKVATFASQTRTGGWDLRAAGPLHRVRGQTLGLLGYGNIAKSVVPKAQGFGLNVLAYSPTLSSSDLQPGVSAAGDLEELFSSADFISVHVPLMASTQGLVDERLLELMKPGAYLINTSRGSVIDEDALYRAVSEGWIAGAALDVMSTEPPPANHPLLGLENVIVTPHTAFSSVEAVNELQTKAVSRVVDTLSGRLPECIVNPDVMQQSNYRGPVS